MCGWRTRPVFDVGDGPALPKSNVLLQEPPCRVISVGGVRGQVVRRVNLVLDAELADLPVAIIGVQGPTKHACQLAEVAAPARPLAVDRAHAQGEAIVPDGMEDPVFGCITADAPDAAARREPVAAGGVIHASHAWAVGGMAHEALILEEDRMLVVAAGV